MPTVSDGAVGGVEENSITFPFCKNLIDHKVLVKEIEIKKSIMIMIEKHNHIIEGSAGVVVAALIEKKKYLIGKNEGVVICGGNINPKVLKSFKRDILIY